MVQETITLYMNAGHVSKTFSTMSVITVSITPELLCTHLGIALLWFVYLFNPDFPTSCCSKDFVVEIKPCVPHHVLTDGLILEYYTNSIQMIAGSLLAGRERRNS